MRPRKRKNYIPAVIAGAVPALVAAYYSAAAMDTGITIFVWMERMRLVMEEPFRLYINSYTLRTAVAYLMIYVLFALMYIAGRKNYMPGKEMGTAEYADPKMVNRRLADRNKAPDDPKNIVVTAAKWRWKR